MHAGLLSELRIKLRDEQPALLIKLSLLNTSMLENEALILQVLGSRIVRKLRRVYELPSALCERSSPMRSPTAMRRRRMPSASESGEGGVEIYRTRWWISIPPSADGWIPGLLDYVSLVYRYAAWMYINLFAPCAILAQGPIGEK